MQTKRKQNSLYRVLDKDYIHSVDLAATIAVRYRFDARDRIPGR